MISRLWIGGLVAISSLSCATPHQRPADHVVLISIDGFVPEVVTDPVAAGVELPTLQALARAGAVASGVVGVYPTLTYPSHTTLITGVRPARHGIVSNTAFDPESGSASWLFDAAAIRATTLFGAARAAGLSTGAVSWPVSVGAPVDALFPETSQFPRDTTWLELARRQSSPGLVDAVVEELGGFAPDGNRDPLGRDRFATAAALHILREHAPALLAVHLVQTDYAQHASGRGSPEARQAFENTDRHIGEIVAAVEAAGLRERTAFVVTGDHGFRNVEQTLQLNQALREAGLLELDADSKLVAWQALAHRAAIRLADPGDGALAERVTALFEGLAEQHPGVFRVVLRAELEKLGADPDALLFVEPAPGYAVGGDLAAESFITASEARGSHGYLPTQADLHTGLILSGSGIASGVELGVVELVDVAPTIARLLEIELPGAEGTALERGLAQNRNH